MTNPDYAVLAAQAEALIGDEPDVLANASNLVGLLYNELDDVNWLGIYVLRGEELVLGPFQGKPACVRIALGSGVCGTAAATRQTQRVARVHEFPGHIVCDEASESELVVPLIVDGRLVGVLDIDSPLPDRFSEADQSGIDKICEVFCAVLSGKDFI
jgi:GAF domain-containing protein